MVLGGEGKCSTGGLGVEFSFFQLLPSFGSKLIKAGEKAGGEYMRFQLFSFFHTPFREWKKLAANTWEEKPNPETNWGFVKWCSRKMFHGEILVAF